MKFGIRRLLGNAASYCGEIVDSIAKFTRVTF